MKKLIMVLTAVLFAGGAFAQNVADNQNKYENYIQVTGRADKEIVPDEIYIRIVINEENMKNKQSVEKMERDMIARLKSIGIDTDKDLKIDNMSSRYKDYVFNKNNPKTSASYQLKVSDAQTLGKVYQAMESLGLSNLNITRLGHSMMKQYQAEIRQEAMRNAREVADQLAGAIGQQAGKAVYIVDYNNDVYLPVADAAVATFRKSSAQENYYETELDFKNIKINYSVTVKFSLE